MRRMLISIGIILTFAVGCNPIVGDQAPTDDVLPAQVTLRPGKTLFEPTGTARPKPTEILQQLTVEVQETATEEPTAAAPAFPLCSQAAIGEVTTCMIESAYCSYQPKVKGSPTFCNDAPYPNHAFTFLVWNYDFSELDGRCLVVSGRVEMYKGKPEIMAENSSGFKEFCDE